MNINLKCISKSLLFALLIMLLPNLSFSSSPVNTATLIGKTVEGALHKPFGNYLNYKITGMCFWLECHGVWCKVVPTLKVDHFLPDAVISVYNGYKQNPWIYANNIIDPINYQIGKKEAEYAAHTALDFGTSSAGSSNDMMQKFKEADIIGNPALPFLLTRLPFAFISSEAMPYVPYYSSLLDAYLWRNPMMENLLHPEYLIPGIRTEGNLIDQWGNIFPRIGRINQLGDFKTAAVIALRAADIATHYSAHLYNPLLSGSCGHDCQVWASHENDFNNVKFQEIYPVAITEAKKTFGVMEYSIGDKNESQFVKGKGNYVFVMWRHYKGCIQDKAGKFLWST